MGSVDAGPFEQLGGLEPPKLRGGLPVLGHIISFARNPYAFMQRVADSLGASGDIELVGFMKQLTINAASHCLLGREFRYELNQEFARIYADLEAGVHPLAYLFPIRLQPFGAGTGHGGACKRWSAISCRSQNNSTSSRATCFRP